MADAVRTTASIVKASKIGAELDDAQCAVLSGLIELKEYGDGDVVVAAGAADDKLRVVQSGALAVASKSADGGWVRLNVLTAGDLAGELAFMDSRPRYAALVAIGPTQLFSLQRSALESLLTRDPVIVYRVMRAIARFAHEQLHRSAAQLAEMNAYVFKSGPKY